MNISEHITLIESYKSQIAERFGINNIPPTEVLPAMKLVAEMCFEPIRNHFGVPIYVSSFYRSKELNKRVKGSDTSQHIKGEAMDIDADIFGGITNKQIFDWAKSNLKFDQLIWEYGDDSNPSWVHISYRKNNNRNQVIRVK